MHKTVKTAAALAVAFLAAAGIRLARGAERPAGAAQPEAMRFDLTDGMILTGRLAVENLTVRTAKGTRKVRTADLVSIDVGLDSRPELTRRVDSLIEALGSSQWKRREHAQKELIEIGPALRLIVGSHAEDVDLERRFRIGEILRAYKAWTAAAKDAPGWGIRPIPLRTLLKTNSGQFVGPITDAQLRIICPYTDLSVKIEQVYLARKIQISEAPRAADQDETLILDLRDGKRVTGRMKLPAAALRTALGKLSVPFRHISLMDIDKDGKGARLLMRNGDMLRGDLEMKKFDLVTSAGQVSVSLSDVAQVSRKTTSLAKLLESYLIHGKVDGYRTDFVKDLPQALAARLKRVTRTARTIGSVISRHSTSPWLYPYKGKGEYPRVLAENGRKYYPIWGMWGRRWGGGWHYYDENNKPRDKNKKERMPHYESKVDYFVVTLEAEKKSR